eukprot:GFUD01015897.1.p1 GENE.GFUD01015897.1~~GFUD01015897.1.p1  ORF type:complete len:267 (-),score=57.21 GFUD01015897.1:115-915(-)
MVCRQVYIAVCVLILLVGSEAQRTGNRAASSKVNCGCQCSSLTFRDKYGKVQGNCKSSDQTRAVWCYVEGWGSSCQDLQNSKRFNKPWSYEACATPPAHLCNGGGGGGGGCGRWGCGGGSGGGGFGGGSGGGGFGGGSGGGGYGGSGSGNSCSCPRSLRLQPVCGRDGRTYSHSCACSCGGSTVQCQGACPCNTGGSGGGYGSGSGGCGSSGCGNTGGYGSGSGGCGSAGCSTSSNCGSLAQILGTCGRSRGRKPKKYNKRRRNQG